MSEKQIDSVVFDIGNVLVRWDPMLLYRSMGYTLPQLDAIFLETGMVEVNHRELDAGKPFRAVLDRLIVRFPEHRDFFNAWDARWPEMLGGPIDPNVRLLADLRRAGIPVHALSNFSVEKFAVTRAMFPFLDSFDVRVISGEIGMVKPDREIFDYLTARSGHDPTRCLFIDDSEANVRAARDAGYQTIHYSREDIDVRAHLRGLGLAI